MDKDYKAFHPPSPYPYGLMYECYVDKSEQNIGNINPSFKLFLKKFLVPLSSSFHGSNLTFGAKVIVLKHSTSDRLVSQVIIFILAAFLASIVIAFIVNLIKIKRRFKFKISERAENPGALLFSLKNSC